MKTPTERKSGFTLAETLIVVTILTIVGTVGVASFGGFTKQVDIDAVTEEIISTLRAAQTKAMSSTENVRWGVCFQNPSGDDNDYYQVISGVNGCVATGSANIRSTIYLPKGISFSSPTSGLSKAVVFNETSGTTVNANSDKITLASSLKSQNIHVNTMGRIATKRYLATVKVYEDNEQGSVLLSYTDEYVPKEHSRFGVGSIGWNGSYSASAPPTYWIDNFEIQRGANSYTNNFSVNNMSLQHSASWSAMVYNPGGAPYQNGGHLRAYANRGNNSDGSPKPTGYSTVNIIDSNSNIYTAIPGDKIKFGFDGLEGVWDVKFGMEIGTFPSASEAIVIPSTIRHQPTGRVDNMTGVYIERQNAVGGPDKLYAMVDGKKSSASYNMPFLIHPPYFAVIEFSED